MDVVTMYDYYFLTDPQRKFDDSCEFGICENNIVYRRMRCAVDECKRKIELSGQYARGHEYPTREREGVAGKGDRTNGLCDVLEYMLYNVSGETGLQAHYSCCMYFYNRSSDGVGSGDGETSKPGYVESGHVCNAIPIMIGSRLEEKILRRLAQMVGVAVSDFYDADYLHKVYSGAFLVNGTFYYSVFRESNNNKICHNSKSKYRGDETVAYFYDKTCNRGVKLFTDQSDRLRINDRDGVELTNVTSDVMEQLYEECMQNSRHYTLDMELIRGFFSAVKRTGLVGIDDFKNKIYTNYSVGLNTFLDKLPSSAMRNPMWNSSLMVGKINFGISQRLSYLKSKSETKKLNEKKLKMCTGGMSTGYLVETQRRRNTRKPNACKGELRNAMGSVDSGGTRKRTVEDASSSEDRCKKKRPNDAANVSVECPPLQPTVELAEHTILGSKDIKSTGLLEKMERGERNGPSTFNQVSVSYLPLIRVLSNTVQKLQVEHVHAESSKTVPRDAYGFVCMKYMGNISTAGKNMLFTDRVQVTYGHVHKVVDAVERGFESSAKTSSTNTVVEPLILYDEGLRAAVVTDGRCDWMYVVINNAVTKWRVARRRLVEFLVFLKTKCHHYAWIKPVGTYLCVYFYEGVPLLRYERNEMMFCVLKRHVSGNGIVTDTLLDNEECLFFSRDELDLLASVESRSIVDTDVGSSTSRPTDRNDQINTTNKLIDRWFMRYRDDGGFDSVDHSSLLAKQLDQYTDYTPPAKRSVSVNARKSACTNVYYQRAAELIRGFNIFVDPNAYERTTAELVEREHGIPRWVTLRDFARIRSETENCPQPQIGGDTTDRSLNNFYMLRTVFADVAGYNVEDANVLDVSVDLNLSFTYSFSLTFVDRTRSGLDLIVPPPRDAASVCCWDAKGNPTAVLFMVCTIRKRCDSGYSDEIDDVYEMLRTSSDVRMVTESVGVDNEPNSYCTDAESSGKRSQQTVTDRDSLAFPPFRKLSVIRSKDGNYHVYFVRNDAVLLRKLRRMRDVSVVTSERPNMSNALRLADEDFVFVCKPEVNPYDVLNYLRTNVTTFEVSAGERVITVDTRVRGISDKYDGVKVVNSFGQKGLALIKDLRPYFGRCPATTCNVPVQLVMNNCSFVSRQPIGQYLQMRKNMFAVASSAAGEPTSVGYSAVFFTETEPVTKSCLVRFDEMMRSVVITLGLTTFQNLKSSLDNVYNPNGLLYPPQMRQILDLYRCFGVAYNFTGDTSVPFASREEVKLLLDIYDVYSKTPKPAKMGNNDRAKALLNILDVMGDEDKKRHLTELGVLSMLPHDDGETNKDSNGTVIRDECRLRRTACVLRLEGQWMKGFGDVSRRLNSRNDTPRDGPDYLLHTYDSARHVYNTVSVYGEPSLIADALDNKYVSIKCLVGI